jgi:dihydrofolate synthase/folylpolyglutamate synthase
VFDLPKYGDGVCLGRLAALIEALAIDRDQLSRNAVVVTGSNGKGSTAAFCATIGSAFGLRTLLFTSPHLHHINERFQIDGQPIGDEALARLAAQVEAAIADISRRTGEQFGSFEALFALACLYFREGGCDFAVFEAGIGGRYDPVRLVGAHESCVTSVDYEHVNLLGTRLELIASDKSDACASPGTIIYGENCRSLRPHLLEYLRHREITARFVRDEIAISGESASPSGQRFDLSHEDCDFKSLELGLSGTFQLNNAAIAATLFRLWLRRTRPETQTEKIEAAVRAGLRRTNWPGRLEVVRRDPFTIVDVGHTPDAVRQSLASLEALHGSDGWILVTGVSSDKKADEIVAALAPSFDTIVCTAAHHKGAPAQAIAAAVRQANPLSGVYLAETMTEAVEISSRLARSLDRKIYVAGGLFVAIEYATVARGGRAEDLRFF